MQRSAQFGVSLWPSVKKIHQNTTKIVHFINLYISILAGSYLAQVAQNNVEWQYPVTYVTVLHDKIFLVRRDTPKLVEVFE